MSQQDLSFLTPNDNPSALGTFGGHAVKQVLGEGSTSIVLAARDDRLKRDVAIRVLKSHLQRDQGAIEGFLEEGRAAAAVEHPNVLPVFEVCTEHGQPPFAVMALHDGGTLEDFLNIEGALPTETVIKIGQGIAEGLAALHSTKIIHGDLKPSNVLLSKDGTMPRLTDFGQRRLARTTPQYQAPECVDGASPSKRSDLFSLGLTLYQLLRGRLPYQSDRGESLAREITSPKNFSMRGLPGPTWLKHLIGSLLDKEPGHRPTGASAVAEALRDQSFQAPRRTLGNYVMWTAVALAVLSVIGTIAYFTRPPAPPEGTPAYIIGSQERFDSLEHAILGSQDDDTIIVRRGVHEVTNALKIYRPLTLLAEKDTQPVIVSRNQVVGSIFTVRAPVHFEGLTFRNRIADPKRLGDMLSANAPISATRCRFEQPWQGRRFNSKPSIIRTFSDITLKQCELDSPGTVGISSRMSRDNQTNQITLEDCAIVADWAVYLHSQDKPGEWKLSVNGIHARARGMFILAEGTKAVPHWNIRNSVIESDYLVANYQPWASLREDTLKKSTWFGQGNVYANTQVFTLEKDRRLLDIAQRDEIQDWVKWIGDGQEVAPLELDYPILEGYPAGGGQLLSRDFSNLPTMSASNFDLIESIRRQHPDRGGDMSQVGP